MRKILLKGFIFTSMVIGVIYYLDSKGYFNPDYKNDHIRKKWNTFYEYTKRNDVDVLFMGNSRLYTGINPKTFCSITGTNAFILAAPGTFIGDVYYSLDEALAISQPKMVVIETNTLSELEFDSLKNASLSDQFRSFKARKSISAKLASTPFIFSVNNYPFAWSNTIRNHSFIFTDPEQMSTNMKLIAEGKMEEKVDLNDLYLGRFSRFKTGIEDSTLAKYDSLGAPTNGQNEIISEDSKYYLKKTIELCDAKGIQVVFLTIPTYYRHVENYEARQKMLAEVLQPYNRPWLDLQGNYDMDLFDRHCFENTYKKNQHTSYHGSILVAHKLAQFIGQNATGVLPNRKSTQAWNSQFYSEEGYFENNMVNDADPNAKVWARDANHNGIQIKEIAVIKDGKGFNKDMRGTTYLIQAKILKTPQVTQLMNTHVVSLTMIMDDGSGQLKRVMANLPVYKYIASDEYVLFRASIKPINIVRLAGVSMSPIPANPPQAQNPPAGQGNQPK